MIGHLISNYKIIEKIGEGGMGDVFRGVDIMLERDIAIKMLRPELARQQPVVERFRAEAVTLAKLNHPNIATLYNFVRQGNDYFMVMEYVKGHTFERLIKQSGAMPYQRALQLFAQALEGIAHAHRLGIIHRDLKPANVMLMDTGLIKIMDFGIARVLGSNRLTRTGNVIGTIEYMSPEQIRGGETDARSDIYSAGILLYEMLTGRVPFECNSEYELMRRQVEDAPVPPRVFTKQIPLGVEQVIMRALAKKPEARFQTADEFRAVLGKNLGEATALLVNASASVVAEQQRQKQAKELPPVVELPKTFDPPQAKPVAAKKPQPTTLDFTSEPQSPSKETALPKAEEAQAPVKETRLAEDNEPSVTPASQASLLKETRLAEEAKAEIVAQQLKETRLAGHNRAPGAQVWHQQAQLSTSSTGNSQTTAPQEKTSSVAAFINKLNWKHYVAAILLALLSIPVAYMAGSDDTKPANQNQSVSIKQSPTVPEQKSQPAAQSPSSSSRATPATPDPAPNVTTPITTAPGDTGSQEQPSETARNNKKTRRPSSAQPAPSREPAKKPDDGDKKEEKKKEKKGGLFDKVKGGFKKINPFKKD